MSLRQYISFTIDDILFGLDILLVKEINKKLDVTPAYDVSDFVVGTSNLRGQVITILDIGCRLELQPREVTSDSRVIVLKSEQELSQHHKSGRLTEHTSEDSVGIVCDHIGDVIELDDRDIQPIPANFSIVSAHFANGIYQMDETLMIMLNLGAALAVEEAGNATS